MAWPPIVSSSDYYILEQSSTSSTTGYTVIYTSPPNTHTSPFSTTVTPSNSGTYYYRVRAYCQIPGYNSYSPYSNVVTVVYNSGGTITLTPSADNLLLYSSLDSQLQNTVYEKNDLGIGQNWVIGPYLSSVLASASAIKFNLPSSLNGKNIVKAELRLYVYMLPADRNTVYKAAAFVNNWSPSTITFANAPATQSLYQASVSPPTGTTLPLVFDVTNIVKQWVNGSWPNYGFLLWDPDFNYPSGSAYRLTGFYSTDYYNSTSQWPQLYIEYQ